MSQYEHTFGDRVGLIAHSALTPEMRERLCKWETSSLKKQTLQMLIPRTQENPRIHSQGGRHILTPNDVSLEAWITDCLSKGHLKDVALTKIVVPNGERREVLRGLNRMNINFLSLFPDFEGAAKHCNMALFDEPLGLMRMRDY